MQNTYLIHHGIKGQKWGVQNGPPYPLDYSKLSEEEREKDKRRAISEGDTRTAQANSKYFTNQEMQNLLTRFDQNTKLSELNAEKIKSGQERVDELIDNWGRAVKIGNLATSTWNIIASVNNAFNSQWAMPNIGKTNKKADYDKAIKEAAEAQAKAEKEKKENK